MTHALAIFAALAILHYTYECVFAPVLRMNLRHRLFALRDDLRRAKFDEGNALEDRQFDCLQESLNGLMTMADSFDIPLAIRVRGRTRKDLRFRERCAERAAVLDACQFGPGPRDS